MTTKYKIVSGFVCMVILLVASSFLGHNYLNKSIAGLLEYRRLARMNVRTSDATTALGAVTASANKFMMSRSPDDMNLSLAALDDLDGHLVEARQDMTNADRQADIDIIRENVRGFRDTLGNFSNMTATVREQYEGKVLPGSQTLGEALQSITETAHSIGNVDMLMAIEQVWGEYAFMLSALGRFYYGHAGADREIIEQRIAAVQPRLQQMRSRIQVDTVRNIFSNTLMPAADSVFTAAAGLIEAAGNADKALADAGATGAAIQQEIDALSAYYNQQMNEYGTAVTAESRSGQKMMLGGSAVGVLIGLLLALFITMGLVRVLTGLARYAGFIAAGDFSYQPKSREKGEVGKMIQAMQAIPQILEKFIAEANATADTILVGNYRNRLDVKTFPGAYKDMAQCITTVSDAYTKTLDLIPLAIITGDLDSNMLFLNETTKKVLGSDMTGKNCAKCFKSPVCNTENCFATRAKASGNLHTGETIIYPDSGANLALSVTAVPFFDKAGKLCGHMEICTDISELKNKQETIMAVAEQATTISDRIAAASEELSGQVELVSRGAETQRDRVSSTASAMTEMNSTVMEVARSAGEASEQSENTRLQAQRGAELVNQVVTSINAVNMIGQTLHGNMQELGKQAESIDSVMNVISDIADQTNLLALNAAIEAARAGEAGRGFAVVADEVRKLAEKTMHATQEVGSSIRAVQQSAHVNIEEVDKAVASVAEADKLAVSSGEALREIVDMASRNSSVVASIATAAEEQSATSDEISRSTEEINKIVAETAEGMAQSSTAVQALSRMAHELRQVMDGLK